MTRIVALSDLHGFLPEIPPCDLLLVAGDICPVRDHSLDRQALWLDTSWRSWLEQVPARQIVGIAGNHDFIFERAPERVPTGLRWTYLQDAGCTMEGLSIWGTPWQPYFRNWAFNASAAGVRGEMFLAEKWAMIPSGVDVLITHGPPLGYGDLTTDGHRVGSASLHDRAMAVHPKLHVFGHIHESHGRWKMPCGREVANVTLVDESYRARHKPMEFRLALGDSSNSPVP